MNSFQFMSPRGTTEFDPSDFNRNEYTVKSNMSEECKRIATENDLDKSSDKMAQMSARINDQDFRDMEKQISHRMNTEFIRSRGNLLVEYDRQMTQEGMVEDDRSDLLIKVIFNKIAGERKAQTISSK